MVGWVDGGALSLFKNNLHYCPGLAIDAKTLFAFKVTLFPETVGLLVFPEFNRHIPSPLIVGDD